MTQHNPTYAVEAVGPSNDRRFSRVVTILDGGNTYCGVCDEAQTKKAAERAAPVALLRQLVGGATYEAEKAPKDRDNPVGQL
jgi:hypothetical protein